ncbi:G-type lectin S-receptor-like serine/threonine-protein kinase isoform X2 [Tanacetum coccineum]
MRSLLSLHKYQDRPTILLVVNENALPLPKQPAFFAEKEMPEHRSISSGPTSVSVNDITIKLPNLYQWWKYAYGRLVAGRRLIECNLIAQQSPEWNFVTVQLSLFHIDRTGFMTKT